MQVYTHNDTEVDVNMTCLQGHLYGIKYDQLVQVFGKPTDGYDKTDAEWHIEFIDEEEGLVVATIYNWKNGYNYCGPNGQPVESITEWNIGGKKRVAAELVERYLKESLK